MTKVVVGSGCVVPARRSRVLHGLAGDPVELGGYAVRSAEGSAL